MPESAFTDDELTGWVEHRSCPDCEDARHMAAELLAARAHIAALEAEKNDPLGYVVAWEGQDGPELYHGDREIVHDLDAALGKLSRMREEEPVMDFRLYPVGERIARQ